MTLDGQLEVEADRAAVEFALTVENAGVEPVELTFPTGQTADFAVIDDGVEIWRWSDGRMFTQAVRTATLAPGESFAESATWPEPRPGAYLARATLATRNVALAASAEFVV